MGMDTKDGLGLLGRAENRLKHALVPFVPKSVETYHLTLATIAWSALVLVFSYLAQTNINWLWGASATILAQYLTDLLDGEIGRQRNTGLVKWGFYMDHFLDYIFLCAIIIGYALLLPASHYIELLFILALLTAFMVNSFLRYSVTETFKIAYLGIGPTEIRLLFIIINTLIIIFGKTYMAFALPYVLAISAIGLVVVVYRTQKIAWERDLGKK